MELNIDFFHIVNQNVAEKGRVLISEPFLNDRYFRRSIVFLCEHNSEGSLGFVLNKPLEIGLHEVADDFPGEDFPLSLGGPVSNNTLHFIHTLGSRLAGSVEVARGIWWGGDFDELKAMVGSGEAGREEVRFFLGYAGWSAGQLDNEMEENAWLVGSIDPMAVMGAMDTEFWNDTLARFNNKYRAWANFPDDPGLN